MTDTLFDYIIEGRFGRRRRRRCRCVFIAAFIIVVIINGVIIRTTGAAAVSGHVLCTFIEGIFLWLYVEQEWLAILTALYYVVVLSTNETSLTVEPMFPQLWTLYRGAAFDTAMHSEYTLYTTIWLCWFYTFPCLQFQTWLKKDIEWLTKHLNCFNLKVWRGLWPQAF
jgi:hypothetical protein